MHISRKPLRALVASAVSVVALMAFGAGPAFAADATWTPSGGVTFTGDLVLELNGGSPVACSNVEFDGGTWTSDIVVVGPYSYDRWWSCAGGTVFQITSLMAAAEVDGGAYSLAIGNTDGTSPFGPYWGAANMQTTFTVPFHNASGSVPSQIVFSDTVIGWRKSDTAPISATGVMDVTRSSGPGTVTLVP